MLQGWYPNYLGKIVEIATIMKSEKEKFVVMAKGTSHRSAMILLEQLTKVFLFVRLGELSRSQCQ